MYQFYFFDLDGTITDSSLGITNSVRYALAKYGIEEPDRKKLYRFIGPPLAESFREFYGFPEEQCQEAIRYYREYYRDKGIYENRVYDGLEEVLKKLKEAGKQLVVATSKPEVFAREIIRYFHLDSYFLMWREWNWTEAGERRQRSLNMQYVPAGPKTAERS